MEPRLIHADTQLSELAEIAEFEAFRADVTLFPDETGTWELTLPAPLWQRYGIQVGHFVYIDESEWGGPVERVQHISDQALVKVGGTGWRDLLNRHIVTPESGSTHVVIESLDANRAISRLLNGWNPGLFLVSAEGTGISCSAQLRYVPLRRALDRMLLDARACLRTKFHNGTVVLYAERLRDLSLETELSQEYDARLISEFNAQKYNHILALGSGEMLERQVVQYWMLPDGTLTDNPAAGAALAPLHTLLYDYPSVMELEELRSAARSKLLSSAGQNRLEFEMSSTGELELADIVSVRDTVTGMTDVLSVLATELSISASGARCTHRLGRQSIVSG